MVTGGCMGGCVGKFLNEDNYNFEKAVERLSRFQGIFGDNFFLEMHTYDAPEARKWNQEVVNIAKQFSIPLLAVSDSHYANPEDWYAHELMTAIQMGKNMNDPDRFPMVQTNFVFLVRMRPRIDSLTWVIVQLVKLLTILD